MSILKPDAIPSFLAELARARFWGSVQIDYQNGEPTLVRKTETTKVVSNFTHGGNNRHELPKQQ